MNERELALNFSQDSLGVNRLNSIRESLVNHVTVEMQTGAGFLHSESAELNSIGSWNSLL